MIKKTSSEKPLVSIVMPVYNAGAFLVEAIESILKQTYQNYELIIVDDQSTDDSWEIIKTYQNLYPNRIKTVQLAINTNAAGNGAVNAVYKDLKGKYIARMDADDISLPDRIKKQVLFMERHKNVILLGSQGIIINEYGEETGQKIFPTRSKEIYKDFFIFHPILHPSVMIRKSMVPQKNYLYENKYGINDDYYTFFRLLQYGQFHNLKEPLLKYRLHRNNTSLQNPKSKFINSLKIRFEAVKKFSYRPHPFSFLLMLLQVIIITILPEKYIIPLYLFIKNIHLYRKGQTRKFLQSIRYNFNR